MIKRLILIAVLFAFTACDIDFHGDFGDRNGYFNVWGEDYCLSSAVEFYPPVDEARDADLVRVKFGDRWDDDDEPGIELLLWTPIDTGMAPGRYVWDTRTTDTFGIAEGLVWGDDYEWDASVVDGTIDVQRWGHSCSVEFNLVVEGGRRVTGHYRGELLQR